MKDDDYTGCGISTIWATDERDPFWEACQVHDGFYSKDSVVKDSLSRKQADQLFLKTMLSIAKESWALKAKAYLYYFIVRCLGAQYWG